MKQIISIFLLLPLLTSKAYSNENDTTITLLNDRLTCTLTKGYTEFSNKNLMGPEPSKEKEQYLKIAEDNAELTMYVNELFVRTSKMTEGEIKEHIKGWKNGEVTYSLSDKSKTEEKHFIKYIIRPNKIIPAANSLYCSVFIENFDNTLISIGFYLNENALKDEQKWGILIDKIIDRIAPGNRQLSSNQAITAKTISDKNVELTLTEDYGILSEKGHGMFVTEITQISSLTDMPSKLTIYSGMHPSAFFKGQGIQDNQLTSKKIKIGTEKLDFKTFTNGNIWAAECLYELSKMTYIHFILVCYDKDVFNEMFEILENGNIK